MLEMGLFEGFLLGFGLIGDGDGDDGGLLLFDLYDIF
jgi:hypothetical protein